MSDYFTNLVTRSFSPAASVQPMEASLSVAPELFAGSFEEFSDPFAKPVGSGKDDGAEAERVISPAKTSPDRPRLEASIGEGSIGTNQASAAGSSANSQNDMITPDRTDTSAERPQFKPPLLDESRSQPKEQPRESPGLAARIPGATWTPSEEPSESAEPMRKVSGARTALVNPGLRNAQKYTSERLASVQPEIATADNSRPETNANRSTHAARKSNATGYVNGEPMDAGVSARHLTKKPAKAVSPSPQTSLAQLTQPVFATADNLQPPTVHRNLVEPITATQKTKAAINTLIPIVSTQPLLPVTVKKNQNFKSQASFEATGQLPLTETIVNVAIGRIEVRATRSESPKRERQTKGPKVMNLDDYLQQRRGNR
jgi:hypothetical protein